MGFGSTRLTVSRDVERALTVLRRAVELGVNHVDTAAFYVSPGGILERAPAPPRYATELIREALAPYDDLVITTKVGPGTREDGTFYQASTADDLRRQVEENLRRLGVDRLDVVNLRIIKKARQDSVAERSRRSRECVRRDSSDTWVCRTSVWTISWRHSALRRWFVCRTAMRSTTSRTPCC
jgi:aryl-alcohol dehydrogenase-like predicted oxidoreductase